MRVYDEISALLKELNGGKITQQRAAGEKLQTMLSKPEIRRKLAAQVSIPESQRRTSSIIFRRRAALSEFWRLVIQCSITAVYGIIDGKSKISESDVILPFKLLLSCDAVDDSLETSRQYAPKLDNETTRMVLKYCLEILGIESIVRLCEQSVLQMLGYLCSRREYVAYFKPQREITAIMEEVERRILADDDKSHNITLEAAKIFENVVQTTIELGIGLEMLIPGCVKLVASWCNIRKNDGTISEMPHIMNGLAILLESNPELSIASVSQHGKAILSFAKSRYRNTIPMHRTALNKYILSHLLTAQVAGKLNGMMSGDLGDLGSASLNFEQITTLLDLAIQDLGKFSPDTFPPDASVKIHLTLVARLLSCAQRLYNCDTYWDEIKGQKNELLSCVKKSIEKENDIYLQRAKEEVSGLVNPIIFASSPFVVHILAPLYALAPDSALSTAIENEQSLPRLFHGISPFLDAVRVKSECCKTDPKQVTHLVQILLACAEIFPAGSCWSSSNVGRSVTPKFAFGSQQVLLCLPRCSTQELAVVVYVMSNILETYGSSISSSILYKWLLLCLARLAENLAVFSMSTDDYSNRPCRDLHLVFRRVWSILLRRDLQYISLTKFLGKGSNGEIMLFLLCNIIRYGCQACDGSRMTQPTSDFRSYLTQQGEVWKLPGILNVTGESPLPFVLIYSLAYFTGLKERTTASARETEILMHGIRHKLSLLCIQFCEKYIERPGTSISIGIASICLASLCNGWLPRPLVVFDLLAHYDQSINSVLFSQSIRSSSGSLVTDTEESTYSSDFLQCLWFDAAASDPPSSSLQDLFLDDALHDVIVIQKAVRFFESTGTPSDGMNHLQLTSLRRTVYSRLEIFLKQNCGNTPPGSGEDLKLTGSSMLMQTSVMKMYLTVLLSQPIELLVVHDFQKTLSGIFPTLNAVVAGMDAVETNQDDLAFACWGMVQMYRAITQVASEAQMDLPSEFIEMSMVLYKSCESLFENYIPADDLTQETKGIPAQKDDFLMDDDFDGDFGAKGHQSSVDNYREEEIGRKRKRKEIQRKKDNKGKSNSELRPLKEQCVFSIAALLLTLNPAASNCERVAKSMMGTDDFDENNLMDIDVRGCKHALDLICSEAPFFHESAAVEFFEHVSETNNPSIPLLACQLMKLLRIAAHPSSDYFLYGYTHCELVVSYGESDFRQKHLTGDEASDILDIFLGPENSKDRRHLLVCPGMRWRQLRTAVHIFKVGKSCLHSVLDKAFPRNFVLPSLQDISGSVRRLASVAVAAAMRVLPEERVIESVRKRLPPVVAISSVEDVQLEYRRWYSSRKKHPSDSMSTREKQMWDDSFLSVQYSVVDCLGTIAGASSNVAVQQQVLFDLIRLSSLRPYVSGLVYQIIAKTAFAHGYNSVKEFLAFHSDNIIMKWICTGESLFRIPLLVTAPGFVSDLLRQGGLHKITQEKIDVGDLNEKHEFLQLLQSTAASEFIKMRCSSLWPKVLEHALNNINISNQKESLLMSMISDDIYVQEICSICDVSSDSNGTETLTKSFVWQTAAHSCLLKSKAAYNLTITEGTSENKLHWFMEKLIAKENLKLRTIPAANFAIKILVESVGNASNAVTSDIAFDALKALSVFLCKNGAKSSDFFASSTFSFVELFIYAKLCLDNCVNTREREKRWVTFDTVLGIIIRRIQQSVGDWIEIGFGVRLLLRIVESAYLKDIHRMALDSLTVIFKEITIRKTDKRQSMLMKDLLYTVYHVHETYQLKLFNKLSSLQDSIRKVFDRSVGIVLLHNNSGSNGASSWGWKTVQSVTSRRCQSAVRLLSLTAVDFMESLRASFCLLQDIINHGLNLGLTKEMLAFVPLDFVPKQTQDALAKIDSAFCAQRIIHLFLLTEKDAGDVIDDSQNKLPAILERVLFNGIVQKTSFASDSVLANETLLFAELTELGKFLLKKNSFLEVDHKVLLIRQLSYYCSLTFSQEVRLLASRCLGEINLRNVWHSAPIDCQSNWTSNATEKGRFLDTLKANCIKYLASCLDSNDANVAMTAVETTKAVLATRTCNDCRDLLDGTGHVEVLNSFFSEELDLLQYKHLLLNEYEIHLLQSDIVTNARRGIWCWDIQLWTNDLEDIISYESWICKLVPALIICCYRINQDLSVDSDNKQFFLFCQRMCYIDPGFAEVLFPTIVLDLLINSKSELGREPTTPKSHIDNWSSSRNDEIRAKLSQCFNQTLACFGSDERGKVLEKRQVKLIVDCVDMLRCYTQYNFMASRHHKQNLPSRKTEISKKLSSDHVDAWRGVPFGTILSLNGLVVADACIQTKRFEAGLFYAELYADSRFGQSGAVFEMISNNDLKQNCIERGISSSDISGIGPIETGNSTSSLKKDVISFLDILRKCYANLGETDAVLAVNQEASDYSIFEESYCFENIAPTFEQLELLENMGDMEKWSNKAKISVVETLEGIGLRNTLTCFVNGLLGNDCFRDDEDAALKEKWFMCRLFDMQWQDHSFEMPRILQSQKGANDSELRTQEETNTFEPSPLNLQPSHSCSGFYECTNRAILSLREKDFDVFHLQLQRARMQLLDQIAIFGCDLSSSWRIVDGVDKLRSLNDLGGLTSADESALHLFTRISDRQVEQECCVGSFFVCKFSSTLTEITLRIISDGCFLPDCSKRAKDLLTEHLEKSAINYSVCGLHKDADAAMRRLFLIIDCNECDPTGFGETLGILKLRLQKARIQERKNDYGGAIRGAQHVIKILNGSEDTRDLTSRGILVDALLDCGKWMTKHKLEHANSVLYSYFTPAAAIAEQLCRHDNNNENVRRWIGSLFSLSQLALSLFESVYARLKSSSWQSSGTSLEERRLELSKSGSLLLDARKRAQSKKKTSQDSIDTEKEIREIQIYRLHLEREIQNTESERQKIISSMEDHRILGLQSIVKALSLSGVDTTEDLSKYIYRFIALWFATDDSHAWNATVSSVIGEAIENIPSFRFVPLSSQLFSRITACPCDTDSCQSRLQGLLINLCLQHPYHCLMPLIAVSNGARTTKSDERSDTKGDVAASLLRTVKARDPEFVFHLAENYEKLTAAYIYLAMADKKEFNRGDTCRIPFERVCKSASIRLDKCLGSSARRADFLPCIVTKPPALRPACDYGDGLMDPIGAERIASFESSFSLTDGGLHRPAIVVCIGTKGSHFRELVKGEDETRQDAVMEQVFDYVNGIMARQQVISRIDHNVTRVSYRWDLKLITYNIVPLSPQAGVLEWVEHAIPFGDFITDKSSKKASDVGAHSRYYPGEWGHSQCRSHLDTAQRQDKRKAFDEICSRNSPVFRFFFIERFWHTLESWYAAKTRYTRSVAVSSIVGHILGIGDRHISNILVHQKTGEVVHIDFGIVFEQGKLLNTPEKVPFRLTRNVVDGMGPLGIQGNFRKAAESTLAALKENSSALLTILSAIVADPLYKWSINSFDNRRKQIKDEPRPAGKKARRSLAIAGNEKPFLRDGEDDEADDKEKKNEAAAHAMRKIQEKLQGYEDGTSGEQQSVEGQISFLINSARDFDNLCVLFPGWAPWC